MKRAAAYIRVSTDAQAEEKTYEAQYSEILERVQSDGATLENEYVYVDEGWSGENIERPALDGLRQAAHNEEFDVVYAYDRGRLARLYFKQEVVIDELAHAYVEFISLHEGNGTSPEEQVTTAIKGIFHQYERFKISERFRLGKLTKSRRGELLGYNSPYGYDYKPITGKGRDKVNGQFVINEAEAENVKLIMEWFANDLLSVREIITKLYELGIAPRKAKRPIWTKGPISRLLKNETYIGRHHYNKSEGVVPRHPTQRTKDNRYSNRHTSKTSRKPRLREEWIEIAVPPIVDGDLFAKVQERLITNKRLAPRNNKRHNYLLTGLIQCKCGQSRTGDPGDKDHLYYRCVDRMHRYPLERTCFEKSVNATVLDKVVWQSIENLIANPDVINGYADKWLQLKASPDSPSEAQSIEGQLAKLLEEERRYAKALGGGYMTDDIYEEQMSSLFRRKKELQTQLSATRAVDDSPLELSVKTLSEKTSAALSNLEFIDKKAIIRKIITKVEANQLEAVIWATIPYSEKGQVGFGTNYRHRRPP